MITVAWLIVCVICFWCGFIVAALCSTAKRADEISYQRYANDTADQEIEAIYHV